MKPEFLPAWTDGSKGLVSAYLFNDAALRALERKKIKITPDKYRVFSTVQGDLGWKGVGLDIFALLPWGKRESQMPLNDLFIVSKENLDLWDFINVTEVLGKLGLVEAVINLDGMRVDGDRLVVSF